MKKVLLSAILVASVMSCVKREDVTDTITNNVSTEEGIKRIVETKTRNGVTTIHESTVTYSEGNKLASVKFSDGATSSFTYQGNLIVKTVSKSSTEDFSYDANGRLSRKIINFIDVPGRTNSTQSDYTYNTDGKLATVVVASKQTSTKSDGVIETNKNTTEYKYVYNSPSSISFTETTTTSYYDSNNTNPVTNPTTVITGTAKLDARGNMIYTEDDKGNKITKTFDDKSRPESGMKGYSAIRKNDGRLPGFINVNNEISKVSVSAITRVDFVDNKQVTTITGYDTTNYSSDFTYDAKGRVIKEVEKREGVETSNTQFFY